MNKFTDFIGLFVDYL